MLLSQLTGTRESDKMTPPPPEAVETLGTSLPLVATLRNVNTAHARARTSILKPQVSGRWHTMLAQCRSLQCTAQHAGHGECTLRRMVMVIRPLHLILHVSTSVFGGAGNRRSRLRALVVLNPNCSGNARNRPKHTY